MLGRSHVMFGLTAAVVLDGIVHISGPPLAIASPVPLESIINKAIFFSMVALGALLPDIDNAQSTIGRKFGWISRVSAILKEDASKVKVDIRDKRLSTEISHSSCALV